MQERYASDSLGPAGRRRGGKSDPSAIDVGRSLFLREWSPGVPTARGGDGLGPVYNDTSCVACHNQRRPGTKRELPRARSSTS